MSEIINVALRKGVCFYCFRLPDGNSPEFGASYKTEPGIRAGGFVAAPFIGAENGAVSISPSISVDELTSLQDKDETHSSIRYRFPDKSTGKDEHSAGVDRIVAEHQRLMGGKTVLSRAITHNGTIDVGMSFEKLDKAYPKAMVFCFYTPESGLWLGATPEILLSRRGNHLESMALAGTRPASPQETYAEWDDKNKEEQELVEDFIYSGFLDLGIETECSQRFTKNAGPVEHICTRITGRLKDECGDNNKVSLQLALNLSPTPALCGLPRANALNMIERTEHHERGFYGGFIGPFLTDGDFRFYVNLRSMLIEKNRYCIFAGGGITRFSDAEKEWEETERKATSLTIPLEIGVHVADKGLNQ